MHRIPRALGIVQQVLQSDHAVESEGRKNRVFVSTAQRCTKATKTAGLCNNRNRGTTRSLPTCEKTKSSERRKCLETNGTVCNALHNCSPP